MDAIFGRKNFRNEIVWQRTITRKGNLTKGLAKDADVILRYSKSDNFTWNPEAVTIPYNLANLDEKTKKKYCNIDANGRLYQLTAITAPVQNPKSSLTYDVMGVVRTWRWKRDRMEREIANGRVVQTKQGNVPRQIRYLDEQKGKTLNCIWTDIPALNSQARERTGWSTQKPLALYERIIQASSNEGDLILDPFCGCATTCVAAERLGRKWIGIDIDPVAEKVTNDRLFKTSGLIQQIDKEFVKVKKNPPKRKDIPTINYDLVQETLWKNQKFHCKNDYCHFGIRGGKTLERKEDITIDHRIPKVRGGSDEMENFIGLCGNCNSRKGGRKSFARFVEEYAIEQRRTEVRESFGK